MLNTIQDGDRVLLYKLGEYRRGDVIVFISPESQASTNSQKMYLIKRIIALPGDTIDIVYDQELDVYVTYVNEIQLDEPYLMTTKDWGSELPRTVVGSDMFFYMGDNRPESRDSRDGQLGSLDKSVILGRAVLRYNIGYSETTGTFDFDVGIINRVK
jgi:signal peptidase I